MGKTNRKDNVRNLNAFQGYYLEDADCKHCLYYRGKKRGCKLDSCCCEDEKLDAISKGRIKRKRGSVAWDM